MGFFDFLLPVEQRAAYNMQENESTINQPFSLDSLLSTNAMTEDKILRIPTAKSCVDLITGTIAQMPVYLYQEKTDGTIERVNDYRVSLLNHEANDYLNGYGLKRNMTKDYLLYGAAYVSIIEAANKVLELHPLPAKSVLVNKRIQNGYRTVGADIVLAHSENGAINNVTQKQTVFKPYELIIALQETHDGLTSKGALHHGAEVFSQALSEMEYTKNLYERGALPLGLLKTDGRMTETQANSLRTAWQNLYGGVKNSAKTVVLQEGMNYQALSMNPVEMQMSATRKATNSEICKLFNVPESMISSESNKYGSIEQNQLHFLKHSLAPIITSLESSLDKALLLESEKDAGYFFRFDTSELVRSTEKERVDSVVAAVKGGVFSINEARAKFDLSPIAEDALLITPGAGSINPETGEVKAPEAATNEEQPAEGDQPNDENGTENS